METQNVGTERLSEFQMRLPGRTEIRSTVCYFMTMFLKSHVTCRIVPPIPSSITGPFIYGHIITDKHTSHFHKHHHIYEDDLDALASVITPGCHMARTANVSDGGKTRVCLIHVDYRQRISYLDLRCSNEFMLAMEEALGIEGEPQWYPYVRS